MKDFKEKDYILRVIVNVIVTVIIFKIADYFNFSLFNGNLIGKAVLVVGIFIAVTIIDLIAHRVAEEGKER